MKVKEFLRDEKIFTSEAIIENPQISIILPTYCRGDSGLLERAIETVLKQTFTNWELIIVDDGSIDSTSDIVKNIIKKDNRIIYIRNDKNSGLPAIRVSQGVLKSRGRYIAYQFDDDMWYENTLEILFNRIINLNNLAVVYGKGKFVNLITGEEKIHGRNFDRDVMIKNGNILLNNTVLHSRELLYIYGTYDCHIAMRRLCDWDLWRRWAKYIEFTFVDEVVSIVETFHENSISGLTNRNNRIVENRQSLDMTKKLSLYNIGEYDIDDLDIAFTNDWKEAILKNDIMPWKKEHGYLN